MHFVGFLKETVSRTDQAATRIWTSCAVAPSGAWKKYYRQQQRLGKVRREIDISWWDAALCLVTFLYLNTMLWQFAATLLSQRLKTAVGFYSTLSKETKTLPAASQSLLYLMARALGVTRTTIHATFFIDIVWETPEVLNTDAMIDKKFPPSSQAPNTTIAVPVRNHEMSSMIERRPKKRCTDAGTEVATKVSKVDSPRLSVVPVATQEALLQEMKAVNCDYDKTIRNIRETHVLKCGEGQTRSVVQLMNKPLYDVRCMKTNKTVTMTCLMRRNMKAYREFTEEYI